MPKVLKAEVQRLSEQGGRQVRIVVLGGGFGGVATARHLERSVARTHGRRDHAREPREFLRHHAASVRSVLRKVGTAALRAANPCRSPAGTLCRGDRRKCRRGAPDRSSRRRRGSHVRPAVRPSRRGARRVHERAADPWLIERVHVQDDGGCAGAQKSPDRTIRASRRGLGADDASRLPHGRRDRRRPRRYRAARRTHGIRG